MRGGPGGEGVSKITKIAWHPLWMHPNSKYQIKVNMNLLINSKCCELFIAAVPNLFLFAHPQAEIDKTRVPRFSELFH